jgi:hypothetical protein
MEKSKRDNKIEALIDKMDTFGEIEVENESYFEGQYDEIELNMEGFFDTLMDNNDRIAEVEEMLEKQQKDSDNVQQW